MLHVHMKGSTAATGSEFFSSLLSPVALDLCQVNLLAVFLVCERRRLSCSLHFQRRRNSDSIKYTSSSTESSPLKAFDHGVLQTNRTTRIMSDKWVPKSVIALRDYSRQSFVSDVIAGVT